MLHHACLRTSLKVNVSSNISTPSSKSKSKVKPGCMSNFEVLGSKILAQRIRFRILKLVKMRRQTLTQTMVHKSLKYTKTDWRKRARATIELGPQKRPNLYGWTRGPGLVGHGLVTAMFDHIASRRQNWSQLQTDWFWGYLLPSLAIFWGLIGTMLEVHLTSI